MKRGISITRNAIAVVSLVIGVAPAMAQTIKKGGLDGTIVSVSASVPIGGTSTIYTTPATGYFILTQKCMRIDAAGELTMGALKIAADTTNVCTSFTPGIAVPPNTAVTCRNAGSNVADCAITGVLSKR